MPEQVQNKICAASYVMLFNPLHNGGQHDGEQVLALNNLFQVYMEIDKKLIGQGNDSVLYEQGLQSCVVICFNYFGGSLRHM